MITSSRMIQFFPTGPFHDMVNAYMGGLSGLLILHPRLPIDLRQFPIGIASIEVPALEIRPHELRVRYERGDFELGSITGGLARLVLNWAYERAKDAYPKSQWTSLLKAYPELEFLRHLHNAAFHRSGLWTFKRGEPRRPAQRRGREVTGALGNLANGPA